jgi:hypothetical protein
LKTITVFRVLGLTCWSNNQWGLKTISFFGNMDEHGGFKMIEEPKCTNDDKGIFHKYHLGFWGYTLW